ncbi:MAG TPA: DMT family transporter [Rickettsia endosymbiont of Proechinophthirus fluctus]|uniref:DMT family transporter n=1 Tax=Rickettsia endosymbiont of Proechinophthirus fluctus TaxID=1462733 RepID=UPI000789E43C|nr:DMT family transporter [Rickettsia endosymbiont of Proechinophthirus fluctus]KYP98756.1 membrane protein [Rickettsia endosymbiont of Proechinophthirus fluctus]HJD53832.1 DMT family transporter [Rickettsia endosymbiont of Proechinophthirus fluctus]
MNDALKTYLTGIGWFLLSLVSSSANDVISKYLGTRLHSFEVAFFRFFFSSIVLLPFIVYYGKNTLKTSRPFVHILRGLLLFCGMTSWTYGLTIAPVTTATVVSFSIPLFTLILAVFFLNENIIWPRWVVTVVGFIGLVITLKPHAEDFNPEILYFVLAAISFAMLDIINKKFVIKESMISMLFYSAIVTAIVSLPVASQYWLTPSSFELALLFVLGSSGSLILFFLLKAFSIVDATATAPYRYLELVISVIAAYFIFNEFPDKSTLHGAVIIIPTTLFIIYSEKKAMNRKHELQ